MNFLEEIDNYIKKEIGSSVSDYRYVNIGGQYLYLEGHSGIILLSDKEMVFALKKKKIDIKGENLSIKYFDYSTVILQGEIIQIQVLMR